MRVELDGRAMTDRDAAHNQISERLHFPDYYGRNLDALYDLLSVYPQPLELVICDTEAMKTALGDYGRRLIAAIEDAAAENPMITLQFL